MHSVIHHGSVLQAYATQLLFEKFGHNAVIINYHYPNKWQIEHGLNVFHPSFKTKIARWFGLKPHNRRRKKILRFMKKYYHLTRSYSGISEMENDMEKFDVYVSGSDQIWNPRFTCADPVYFFTFVPDGSNLMSFSSSFACKSLDADIAEQYKSYLIRYQFISVRENQGAKIIKALLDKTPTVTLDPTLMINADQWLKFIKPMKNNEKYIFMYILDYAFNPKPYIYELVSSYSIKYNVKVISNVAIPSEYNINHLVCNDAGIEDFLTLIYNSFIVITSSFHGVAFAVNFGKPVIGVVKDGSDDRISSLLCNLDLNKNIAKIGTPIDALSPFYEFNKEQNKLNELRLATKSYLNTALTHFEK